MPALFRPVFEDGWRIRFAHRTFAWTSEAPKAASVYCTIVGFDRERKPAPRLFEYSDIRGEPEEQVAREINGYLVDGSRIFVEQRRQLLSPELPPFTFGSMPRGAALIVEQEDYDEVARDPVTAKCLRPFKMGKELIHNIPRWCLWMVDLDPADLQKSKILRERIEANREFRLQSSADSTRKMAATPHLFGQRAQPEIQYLAIPKVFSENRRFATVALLEPEVIAGDKLFTADDPDGFAFAIASSSMFITWQKTVGGRLKSDVSFSNTVVWNNLPLPRLESDTRQNIIEAGQGVIAAREQHPERTLAQHYNPLVMDPALLKAHAKLDTLVDRAFGAKGTYADEKERQEILFARYAELTSAEQL